tara:strand:- start:1444 stop:2463 length:1020 start_codon:yes stop_codon:yes gene_type:complete
MSKKNSSVILKNSFRDFKDLNKSYLNFKKKLDKIKKKSFLLAISGGPDSLALAALSKAYSYERKVKFYYLMINHNIRKNSTKEAQQVKSLLKKNDISLKILTNQKKIDRNIQGQARNIRYEMISNFCKKNKINIVLTAHNFEDQVETFFIRLSRGSGLTGLSSMKMMSKLSNNLKLFRPFLDTKKKVLIKISKIIFKKFIKDPSNQNNFYLRTKIRNLKLPLEKSGINYEQITKSINNLASSKATLDEYYAKISKEVMIRSRHKITFNLNKFNKYNNEIKIMLINDAIKFLKKNYYNPRAIKVQNLIDSFTKPNCEKMTLGGCFFVKKNDFLTLTSEKS